MIHLEHVTKVYGTKPAVRDLTLDIPAGEPFAFLGPNGAGKTTTIKMMCGLLFPTSGRVLIGGHDLLGLRPARRAHPGPAVEQRPIPVCDHRGLGAAAGVVLGGAAVVVPVQAGVRALRKMEF
jgi:ABC-type Na+ transport system ATPase subunit NatA